MLAYDYRGEVSRLRVRNVLAMHHSLRICTRLDAFEKALIAFGLQPPEMEGSSELPILGNLSDH